MDVGEEEVAASEQSQVGRELPCREEQGEGLRLPGVRRVRTALEGSGQGDWSP